MAVQLRDYQQDQIQRARIAMRKHRRVLLQGPTGSGKTALASFMAGEAAAKGLFVWFICHRAELIDGTSKTFGKFDIAHGVVAAGYPMDIRQPVQVCSIDTLKKRMDVLPAPGLVVWDECHHLGAASWAAVQAKLANAYHIGLSATPKRLDGRPLDVYFDDIVLGPQPAWLIERGYLSPYRAFAPSAPDMAGVRKQMGDYAKGETEKRADTPKLTGDIITHWRKLANGLRTVGFGVTVAHSQHLAAQFCSAGISAAHLDGNTHKAERKRIITDYAEGRLQVLFNVDLFGEGFDLASIAQQDVTIDCVIDAAPTQSLTKAMQRWGRMLRPGEGKVGILLDHAGNVARHGLPDDEREWSLDGRDASKAANDNVPAPPVTCEGCYGQIRRPCPPACPYCGHMLQKPAAEIIVAAGVLEEITEAKKLEMRRERNREQAEAKDLGALVALAHRRGYRNPMHWAQKVFAGRRRA